MAFLAFQNALRSKSATVLTTASKRFNSTHTMRVAVLHQAIEPPIINGARKPRKPGGYQDSGADIAFVLREQCKISTVTPIAKPDPNIDEGWSFPDTEDGILFAIDSGANCLWANTILFAKHPLQISKLLNRYAAGLRVIGQPPSLVEACDDKNFVNHLLYNEGAFTLPYSCLAYNSKFLSDWMKATRLELPVVAKPRRGRGSEGVKVCRTMQELSTHVDSLGENNTILEDYLTGAEATVTVMPPSAGNPNYWSLPIVARFNHQDGIAPYNGTVAVTANSRAISLEEAKQDPAFARVSKECEGVAEFLKVTAPIRIDVRKRSDGVGEPFVLFDVNMKPNMTAPGRPGREDQASLTALAAAEIGWGPARLFEEILKSSRSLEELRGVQMPETPGGQLLDEMDWALLRRVTEQVRSSKP